MDLLLVDIYCISAIGFYQNLVQPNTVAFTTRGASKSSHQVQIDLN
jgi:hypothetical protein